jgi:hypothetical protein
LRLGRYLGHGWLLGWRGRRESVGSTGVMLDVLDLRLREASKRWILRVQASVLSELWRLLMLLLLWLLLVRRRRSMLWGLLVLGRRDILLTLRWEGWRPLLLLRALRIPLGTGGVPRRAGSPL